MRYLLILLSLCFALQSAAQEKEFSPSQMAVVVLSDKEHVIGKVILNSDYKVVLLVNGKDKREYSKSTIRFFKVLDQNDLIINRKYMFPAKSQTHYLYSTSAFTLDEDRFAFHLTGLYSELQIPTSKSMDIGIGTFVGAPISLTVKKRFAIGSSLNVALKGYAAWASYFFPSGTGFAGQALITNGSKERNITFGPGIGVGMADGEAIGVLFSSFGVKARINQKYSIVADGMYVREMESSYFLGIFTGMIGLHKHSKRNITWSSGLGVGGFQEMNFNFWGNRNLETLTIPMIYLGFRKVW